MPKPTSDFTTALAALVEQSKTEAPKATYIAIHLLHACLIGGLERDFARHVCGFNGGVAVAPRVAQEGTEDLQARQRAVDDEWWRRIQE